MTIDILLATYNGAGWLRQQLDSLLAQTIPPARILIRDDGSKDGTILIVNEYIMRDKRIRLIPKRGDFPSGAAGNFAALLMEADADYAMFCDQDDVWIPDKIERSLNVMKQLKQVHGKDTPLLVHTDATITDRDLKPLASFTKHHHLNPDIRPFSRLLVQNTAHGCTILANRALVALARPIPPDARMHDMWLALVASAFGQIAYLDEPTLLYRQHGANVIGARKLRLATLKASAAKTMHANIKQAAAFLDRFGSRLDPAKRQTLEALLALPGQSPMARRISLCRHGLLRRPLWQNLPFLLFI